LSGTTSRARWRRCGLLGISFAAGEYRGAKHNNCEHMGSHGPPPPTSSFPALLWARDSPHRARPAQRIIISRHRTSAKPGTAPLRPPRTGCSNALSGSARLPRRTPRFAHDSPLEGVGFEPSVPRRGTAFFETPVRASGARISAREEIGPAEKERPFRGGLIDIVGRWNSSLNINLTPVVDDEDRLPFAWAGQATLDHVRWRNCGARRSRYRAYRRPTGRHRRAPAG